MDVLDKVAKLLFQEIILFGNVSKRIFYRSSSTTGEKVFINFARKIHFLHEILLPLPPKKQKQIAFNQMHGEFVRQIKTFSKNI